MRSLIALLEAPKPTRNALISRQLGAFLRKTKIDLGPNFYELEANIDSEPGYDGINLWWTGAGDYSTWDISILLRQSNPSNTALIALTSVGSDELPDETWDRWEREWYNARPAARDKIAQAICGNVGIVPGSIAGKSHLEDRHRDAPYYWFHIVPGSTLANMVKLIPETDEQSKELERIFNKGKHPT